MEKEPIYVVPIGSDKRVAVYKKWDGKRWVYPVKPEKLMRWFWPLPLSWETSGWGSGGLFIEIENYFYEKEACRNADTLAEHYKHGL